MTKIISLTFAILCSLFIFSTPALAKVVIEENGRYTLAKGETLDDDLFVGAETVSIDGVVTGDVFVAAGSVQVSGEIKGGLFVGTGDLILEGATIGNSLVVGAGDVMIDSTSSIGGSLIVGSGNLSSSASVTRSIMAGAGTIYLNGVVGKEARLAGGTIDLGPKTAITGNLTYALGEDSTNITQDPSSSVAGTISRYTPPEDARRDLAQAREDMGKFSLVAHRGWLMISFLGSLLLGFLLLRLFPKSIIGLSQTVEKSLLRSLGLGLLIVILFIPLMLVLALTVVALPIVGFLIPLFMLGLTLAKLVTSYSLGRFVARQFNWNKMGIYAILFIGLAIFYLLRAIPGIGWVTSVIFTWVGLGSIWIYTRSHLKNL